MTHSRDRIRLAATALAAPAATAVGTGGDSNSCGSNAAPAGLAL